MRTSSNTRGIILSEESSDGLNDTLENASGNTPVFDEIKNELFE
jgi:hypothetical protein